MRLIIENIRTFAGRHEIPIKPLTILTGENSSGKTSVLACLSVASDAIGFPLNPRFDDPPYNLGGYDSIATDKVGGSRRAKTFLLGWADGAGQPEALATYGNHGGSPRLVTFRIPGALGGEFKMVSDKTGETYRASQSGVDENGPVEFSLRRADVSPNEDFGGALARNLAKSLKPDVNPNGVSHLAWEPYLGFRRLHPTASIGPISARPQRTYDPISHGYSPDGGHVPFVLAKWLSDPRSRKLWEPVRLELERFGAESGLFERIEVRHLGKPGTDPFQVLVSVEGRLVNLMDVGYGISQIVRVIIESLFFSGPSALLIQQPELHLHPKAQAALGSFFSRLVANRPLARPQINFAVETHSDYIVDRIRREIAEKTLNHGDVVILYFEREGPCTKWYPLSIDPDGNIVNAPASYRAFFLKEEISLLTRAH